MIFTKLNLISTYYFRFINHPYGIMKSFYFWIHMLHLVKAGIRWKTKKKNRFTMWGNYSIKNIEIKISIFIVLYSNVCLFQNTNIIYTLEEISNQSLQFGDNELIQEIFVPDDREPQTDEEFAACSSRHFTFPSHISPPLSTPSTSSSTSNSNSRIKKKFRSNPIDDEYASAINHLAESMSQPITINSTDIIRNTPTPSSYSIDTFVVFIRSLLRTIKNEGIKLEAMNSITQTAFDAKSNYINNAV